MHMHGTMQQISVQQVARHTVSILRPRSRFKIAKQLTSCSAQQVKARWCIDIRYGVKVEAVSLLQEWVRDIGSQAGLTAFNTQINSGSLGVPESRMELEVIMQSLSELEQFRGAIPADLHRAWSQRAQHYIIDGSPIWQVFVSCPVLPAAEALPTFSATAPPPEAAEEAEQLRTKSNSPGCLLTPAAQCAEPVARSLDQQMAKEDVFRVRPRARPRPQLPVQLPPQSDDMDRPSSDRTGPVDWKGDPMIINPGDRLPL